MLTGNRYKFEYPDYGTPDGYPEYTAHSGQLVTVLAEVETDIEVEKAFRIEAPDGWRGVAFQSELAEEL